MKFCVSCGKQIDDSVAFCPYCGGQQPQLRQEPQPQPEYQPQPRPQQQQYQPPQQYQYQPQKQPQPQQQFQYQQTPRQVSAGNAAAQNGGAKFRPKGYMLWWILGFVEYLFFALLMITQQMGILMIIPFLATVLGQYFLGTVQKADTEEKAKAAVRKGAIAIIASPVLVILLIGFVSSMLS